MGHVFLEDSSWTGAVHEAQSDAPLQVGHARCGCRSWWHVNQLRLRLRRRVWHGRVVLVVRRLCHGPVHWVLWSGLRHDVLGKELIVGVERRGLFDCIAESAVAVGAQATPTSRPRLVGVQEVSDCASCPLGRRLAPPCFVHGQAVERAIENGAGKSRARLLLNAALEAAEDGHVAGLQVRSALWWEEAQDDVRESGPHGCQCGLAGVDAGHVPEEDPRLSLPTWVQHVVKSGHKLQDRGGRGPAVFRNDVAGAFRPGFCGQDGVCLARVHDLHEHVQQATVHAEGDREGRGLLRVALQLGLLLAEATPSGLVHRQEAARGLVDVHDAVCADCVLVHEPAQLDEESVRVGVLLLRAVELFQALGGLLEAQAHATQKFPYPPVARAHVEPLCVEPLEHHAVDRDRAQAQDVGDLHDVLAEPRRVCGRQHASPAARLCSWRAPLPAVGGVLVDAVEHSGAQALDLAQAPPHVPAPLGLPLVHHVEEPVAGDGIHEDLAALRCAAAGLVFDGRGGRGSTRRLDLGELLVCERPVDGFSWSPPGRALQADALRELVAVHDVLLQGAFPELLPAGPAAGLLRVPVWWPTQTNRQAMAARSARKSSTGCSSCCEEEREDSKRFIGRRGHGENTFV